MYKLTIVVAIYNVENYLKKCLDSLVNQTCGDYQVFCVNDGSTDKSRDIILSYLDNKKFKLLDIKGKVNTNSPGSSYAQMGEA